MTRTMHRMMNKMLSRSLTFLGALLLLCGMAAGTLATAADTPRWNLPDPHDVTLGGSLGEAFNKGVQRLAEDPYKSVVFLRSDVSFEMKRWFTNYSGDISGRFIEAASMTSPRGKMQPEALAGLLKSITDYQKPDGHYGVQIDWSKPFDPAKTKDPRQMPIFWGNARLLVGLLEAYRDFGDKRFLESAKKMGDFYIATADMLMDPKRDAEYRATGTYAHGYITCYFYGMEGLVRLYQATKDERYLKQAERMAGFMKPYDKLPLEHSHGSLGEYHGLMLLHEVTGKPEYLNRAVARWEEAVKGGYVWPTGGVGEMFKVAFRRDEGCSECDWLRVNLDLWQATGQTRYLDMAERLLLNHYAMNQTPNGGFGHHEFINDDQGPLLMQPQFTEAVWCCTFHGLMGLNTLKKYVITGSDQGIYVNFPMDAAAKVKVGKETWNVKTEVDTKAGVMKLIVNIKPAEEGSRSKAPKLYVRVPEWASNGKAAGYKTIGNADGYMILSDAESSNESAQFTFAYATRLEDRRFHEQKVEGAGVQRLKNVVLRDGGHVLFAASKKPRPVVVLPLGKDGKIQLPKAKDGGYPLPLAASIDVPEDGLGKSEKKITLADWEHVKKDGNIAFVFDVIAVPDQGK